MTINNKYILVYLDKVILYKSNEKENGDIATENEVAMFTTIEEMNTFISANNLNEQSNGTGTDIYN